MRILAPPLTQQQLYGLLSGQPGTGMQQLVDIDLGRFPARHVGHGFILLCALLGLEP